MTLPTVDPIVRAALRTALALLFGWAALHKLRDVGAFRSAVAAYALAPTGALSVVTGVLLTMEVGVALMLVWPFSGAVPALGASILLATYAGAIALNLVRGRVHIDCGCDGAAGRRPIRWSLVVRNLALGAVALLATLPATLRRLVWMDGITLLATVAALVLVYAAADGLLARAAQLAVRASHRPADDRAEVGHG